MGFPRNTGRLPLPLSFRRAVSALTLAALWVEPMLAAPAGGVSRSTRAPQPHARLAPISAWESAERSRDAFEATPETTRTRSEYTRVMDHFRSIYHENPRDPQAPEAINAVAELLAEEGRDLRERKSFEAAVGQYEFLRTQYPGSSLRVGALLAQAQIEQNDLHDAAAARERYELLLRSYPRSALAEQARAGIASLTNPSRARRAEGHSPQGSESRGATSARTMGGGSSVPAPDVRVANERTAEKEGRAREAASAAKGEITTASLRQTASPAPREATAPVASKAELPLPRQVARHPGPLATVSGIRHWSTPSYTRVAIDLGEEVQYEAARVPSPDRIFFDLHGARLAPDLVGKSFAVTDDGFLKRIRAVQSAGDVTRVVLDVNDVTEYSAFLLPNPYRLIIDIHGRPKGAPAQPQVSVDSPAPHAVTVPNTRAMRASSPAEVSALSDQPGKVEATSTPTSQPIAMSVAGREPSQDGTGAPVAARNGMPGQAAKRPVGVADTQPVGVAPTIGTNYGAASALPRGTSVAKTKRGRSSGRVTVADARVVGEPANPARAAVRTADGETSLVRALGLKINRIVIDAGHGGHDSGTIGVDGLEEKDVVLDVALRLGKLLHDGLGADVIYTRSDDTFIPLETRTAIANKAQADLFLSIHANSSPDPSARGVETYYLNFTQQADALEVAARENAVSGQSIHQLSDLVRKITLKDKLAESREFATDVEGSLYAGLARGNEGLKNRGVKKAPFVVLIGANMPSVLAEISFVSNPRDAAELRRPEYKERVAESLYRGVARYVASLSSTTPAAPPTERAATGP